MDNNSNNYETAAVQNNTNTNNPTSPKIKKKK